MVRIGRHEGLVALLLSQLLLCCWCHNISQVRSQQFTKTVSVVFPYKNVHVWFKSASIALKTPAWLNEHNAEGQFMS